MYITHTTHTHTDPDRIAYVDEDYLSVIISSVPSNHRPEASLHFVSLRPLAASCFFSGPQPTLTLSINCTCRTK